MSLDGPALVGFGPEAGRSDDSGRATCLELLGNPTARTILTHLGRGPLTARELADRTTVALSTTYRYLEVLAVTGLVEESVRLDPAGRHASQYARNVGDFVVPLTDDFTVSVSLS